VNRASAPKARSCGRPDGEERRTINKENEERELQVYIGDAVGVPGDSIKALLLGRKPINGATARLSRPGGNCRISQACRRQISTGTSKYPLPDRPNNPLVLPGVAQLGSI
jgi:hypothetical protein